MKNHVTEEMQEVLNEDNFGTFCVCPGCDPKYAIVFNATNPVKKPSEGAPKRQYERGYKKSDEKIVKQETPVLKDANGGCILCGKKRHVKTSDCPNNKNK